MTALGNVMKWKGNLPIGLKTWWEKEKFLI
jgi:hypothetical protein